MRAAPAIFSPLCIRGVALKNRLVMLPMSPQLGTDDGCVTPRIVDFYRARARGGVGTIIVGATYVDPRGGFAGGQMGISRDEHLIGLRRLAATIKDGGARALIQLHHAGRRARSANTGLEPVAPSAIPEFEGAEVPKALTVGQIEGLVDDYARAAARAEKAGFDGVEIHCAHGYLPDQFFNPRANARNDAYGGDLEGRTLFARQLISACRGIVSSSFLITVRLSGENGMPLADMVPIARRLEEAGVDMINVSAGDTPERTVPDYYWPAGVNVHLAETIRRQVQVPVLACGRVRTVAEAESMLQQEQADLVGLGRALLADPEFPQKAARGDLDSIFYCFSCNQVCHNPLRKIPGIACSINARTGREGDFPFIPATDTKRVIVVGGGLAGCQAALAASERGHTVTLFEETERLGGKLVAASSPPGKKHFLDVVKSFERALEQAGVRVVVNKRADMESIMQEKPHSVILATGSHPLIPPVSGIEVAEVVTAEAVLTGTVQTSSPLVVVGAGAVGLETAHLLLEQGHNLVVIDMLDRAGEGLTNSAKEHLLGVLDRGGVAVVLNTTLVAVEPGYVRVEREGVSERLMAKQVVLATGYEPRQDLVAPLGEMVEVVMIGDAAEPRDIEHAILEGLQAAYNL